MSRIFDFTTKALAMAFYNKMCQAGYSVSKPWYNSERRQWHIVLV